MRTRRVLEQISETLVRIERGQLNAMSETLTRIERDSRATLGAIHNLQQVNREILLELRQHRPILERIDDGVQANTEGLMHVLDELRGGRGGPGAAPIA